MRGSIALAALFIGGLVLSPLRTAHAEADWEDATKQIGASLGIATGGGLTAGGAAISGHYLHRLSTADWFEGGVGFRFGQGGAACFRNRANELVCDHDVLSGFAAQAWGAVRRSFAPNGDFVPFVRAGIGLRMVQFSADDAIGVAFPVIAGAGVRALIDPRIALVGAADLEVGPALFNRGLGLRAQASMVLSASVEVRL